MRKLFGLILLVTATLPVAESAGDPPVAKSKDAPQAAEPAKLDSGISFEPYKTPDVDTAARPIVIKSTDPGGAGLFIRTQNTSDYPELLLLRGGNGSEPVNLRIRRRDDVPTYGAAPNGVYRTTLAPGEKLELLIYLDKPFHYSILDINKQACHDCLDSASLRALILAENPRLKETLDSGDWEQSIFQLLNWTANQVDLGISARTETAFSLPAPDLTYLFRKDEVEGSCGLFADYFCKVLKDFGFEAMTLDFGLSIADSLTHVTTVVRAPDGKFYFFDPTFNAAYRTADGQLVDIVSLLESKDAIFTESNVSRDVAYHHRDVPAFKSNDFVKQHYDFLQCADKSIGGEPFLFCPGTPYSSSSLKGWWKERLIAKNIDLQEDLFRRMLIQGEIYSVGRQSPDHREELIALLTKNGVRFKSP